MGRRRRKSKTYRGWNYFRNLLFGGNPNIFAKLCKSYRGAGVWLGSKEIQEAGGLVAFIETVARAEAHSMLLERISALESVLCSLRTLIANSIGK